MQLEGIIEHVAQFDAHASQFLAVALGKVPGGQREAVTQVLFV